MKSFTALLGSLLLLSLLSALAYGQTAGTGAIAGVVSDPSGAVVSQATIKVTNNQTGRFPCCRRAPTWWKCRSPGSRPRPTGP